MANALNWYRDALRLVLRAPGKWLMIGALYFVVRLLIDLVPVVGPTLRQTLGAIFEGGLLFACRRTDSNQLEVRDMLAGFQQALQPLLMLGVVSMAAVGAAAITASSLEDEAGFRWVVFGEHTRMEWSSIVAIEVTSILVSLPLAFASALIMFHGIGALGAIKHSTRAVLVNLPALVTASAVAFVIVWLVLATLPPLLIALLPWLLAASYTAYRDVFHPDSSPKSINAIV